MLLYISLYMSGPVTDLLAVYLPVSKSPKLAHRAACYGQSESEAGLYGRLTPNSDLPGTVYSRVTLVQSLVAAQNAQQNPSDSRNRVETKSLAHEKEGSQLSHSSLS